jgi:hypothetical protein
MDFRLTASKLVHNILRQIQTCHPEVSLVEVPEAAAKSVPENEEDERLSCFYCLARYRI